MEVLPDTVPAAGGPRWRRIPATAAVAPLLAGPSGEPVATGYRVPSAEDFAAGRLRVMPIDADGEAVTVEYAGRDALLVRKQFLRGMNYFDERFGEHWADLDLAMQIRRAGQEAAA